MKLAIFEQRNDEFESAESDNQAQKIKEDTNNKRRINK